MEHRINSARIMAADALALCVARLSAAMLLIMLNMSLCSVWKDFQYHHNFKVEKWCKIQIYISLTQSSTHRVNQLVSFRRLHLFSDEISILHYPGPCSISSKTSYCTLTHLPLVPHIWIRSALVQTMACRLFGAKPLSEPMLGYYQLDP